MRAACRPARGFTSGNTIAADRGARRRRGLRRFGLPHKVLIFHGYLLHGTGSNIYNASLAQALARPRPRGPSALPGPRGGLARLGRLASVAGRTGASSSSRAPGAAGRASVTVYLPDIGGLLARLRRRPLRGLRVKTFAELTDVELDGLPGGERGGGPRRRRAALGGVDAALANHLVMGPAILARAGLRLRGQDPRLGARVHGQAAPERFLPYAREGMDAAAGVLVGSRHTAESLWGALGDPGLPARTRLGPPGVDTDALRARWPARARAGRLAELAADLARGSGGGGGALGSRPRGGRRGASTSSRTPSGPRVVFVGKLIVSKGVDLLLAAWPLVHAANPGARLLMVGFGEYDGGAAGASGRRWRPATSRPLREMAPARARARGRARRRRCGCSSAFLDDPPPGYAEAAPRRPPAASRSRAASSTRRSAAWCPPPTPWCCRAPSRSRSAWSRPRRPRPASLPVSAAHSGAAEVSRALAAALPPEAAELVSFALGDGAVAAIAERLNGWLGLDARHSRAGASRRCARRPSRAVELGGRGPRRAGRVGRRARRAPGAACAACHQLRYGRRVGTDPSNRMPRGDPRHPCQAHRRDHRADRRHGGADDADPLGRHRRPRRRRTRSTRCST